MALVFVAFQFAYIIKVVLEVLLWNPINWKIF